MSSIWFSFPRGCGHYLKYIFRNPLIWTSITATAPPTAIFDHNYFNGNAMKFHFIIIITIKQGPAVQRPRDVPCPSRHPSAVNGGETKDWGTDWAECGWEECPPRMGMGQTIHSFICATSLTNWYRVALSLLLSSTTRRGINSLQSVIPRSPAANPLILNLKRRPSQQNHRNNTNYRTMEHRPPITTMNTKPGHLVRLGCRDINTACGTTTMLATGWSWSPFSRLIRNKCKDWFWCWLMNRCCVNSLFSKIKLKPFFLIILNYLIENCTHCIL